VSRKLVVNDGRRERELLLVGTMVVGRDPTCDISDADPLLSRRHVEFISSPKEVTVRDLGSRNGILINGVKIAQSVLRAGDVVQVGHLQVRFIEDSAPLATPLDETALAPHAAPRNPSSRTGHWPSMRVDAPTMATQIEEPTERVARPGFSSNQATIDTEIDKTIPTTPQNQPRASGPAAADPDKTRFAAPPAQIAPDPDKTRFAPPPPPAVDSPSPTATPIASSPVVESPAAVAAPEASVGLEAARVKPIVITQVALLAAVVFVAAVIPALFFSANGSNRVAALVLPAIVALGAAWYTSRQILRQTMKALAELNDAARRPSRREG
jgi:pSer/pThr/pTyr-binding forkhead associated (FHA) protein